MKKRIRNLKELEIFANHFSKVIENGDVYSLVGDLGTGKTTLVQLIGKEKGVSDYITSPTFSIVNIYDGDYRIYHLDLYRLDTPEELDAFDYETYFYPEGVTFIEWASQGGYYIPENIIEVNITYNGDERIIEINEDSDRKIEICNKLRELGE